MDAIRTADAATAQATMGAVRSMRPERPLRVGVLVDLEWSPAAGGHVKFWERVAAGAVGLGGKIAGALDLTLHFAADVEDEYVIGRNVRYRLHKPVFSTRRLPFLSHAPDHTDLAPYHPTLARLLPTYDVIHTTDGFFCFAKTALRIARRHGVPIVNSVHTDTPRYARLYMVPTVHRVFGDGWFGRFLLNRVRVHDRAEARALNLLRHHQSRSRFVLGPRDEDLAFARQFLPPDRVLLLPRGLELGRFHPRHRDRAWLRQRFDIAPETPVVLYAGRINDGKNVMTLAEAVHRLAAGGTDLRLICLGEGDRRVSVMELLGGKARCPGTFTGDELARSFASADILAHPSEIESFANVVAEGMASGLPALVSAKAATRLQVEHGVTGSIVDSDPADWADALCALIADGDRRRAMGRAARARVEERFKSWDRVAADSFLPIWRRAAGWPESPP